MKTKTKRRNKRFLWILLPLIVCIFAGAAFFVLQSEKVDRSGWYQSEGKLYYRDESGLNFIGWQQLGQNLYYFEPDGAAHIGWLEQNGHSYYFGENGSMVTGRQTIDGLEYHFDEGGTLITGWYSDGENKYYYDENNKPVTGLLTVEEQTYFFGQDGKMQTGWFSLDMGSRYFCKDGAMATGWTEINGSRFYFDESGQVQSGWIEVEEVRYYLREDGTAYSGWLSQDGKDYYINEDGSMAVGPTEIDGVTHYFSPLGIEVLLVNPWCMLPEDYEVELCSVGNGYQISSECYDALMQMLDDCRAAGKAPYLCSAYRTMDEQEYLYYRLVGKFQDLGYSYENALVNAATQVAIPGTSEHQLGLAVDIVSRYNTALNSSQESTETQKWLMEHCWEYGFILRYPTAKTDVTGIIYEPWHYRYVGVEIAMDMKDSGLCLEEYLGFTHEDSDTN